jgi:peptide/nickel transport system substrate-binding protein
MVSEILTARNPDARKVKSFSHPGSVRMRTGGSGMRVTRKLLAGLAAGALLLGACGDDDDGGAAPESDGAVTTGGDTATTGGDTGTTAAGSQPVAGTPKPGGTIVIGIDAETDRFDPGNGNISVAARGVHHLVYGSLTAATPDGEWTPYLAESVTPNADNTEWTVTLRPGLMFHDGTPLDGAALKASMDRYRLDTLAKEAYSYITAIDEVDDLSVKLTLNKPMGVFPQVLADELGTIVSVAAVEKYGESYGDHPTGAGPYKVVEYVRDDHLTLEKVPDFFMDNRGWADRIIFRPIPDDAARSAALRAGDLDVITTANPAEIASFRDDESFRLHEFPFGAAGVLFSVKNIPDIRVRQAIAMAIDKQALVDLVWGGIGEPIDSPWEPDSPWYTDLDYPEYDPVAAAALVEEVEAETGTPISFSILSPIDETSTNYKLALAEQLRALGMDVDVADATDVNDYVNKYITGDYDITTAGLFAMLDPWFEYTRRYQSTSPLNGTGFKSQALDDALAVGEASTDPAERKAAYDTVQKELADNLIQMFVRTANVAVVTNDKIEGWATLVGPDGERSIGNAPILLNADEFWRNDS